MSVPSGLYSSEIGFQFVDVDAIHITYLVDVVLNCTNNRSICPPHDVQDGDEVVFIDSLEFCCGQGCSYYRIGP